MVTDFQKVCEFNKCFDFPQHDTLNDDKCLQLRLDLIKEELDELKDAYDKNDIIEEQDACADILYVAYGMEYTYKYNSDDYIKNYYYYLTDNGNTLFKNLEYNTSSNREVILNRLFEIYYILEKTSSTKDIEATMNVLHKLIYHVYEFQHVSKYDSDKIFTIVHDSNMSKLCKTIEEAEATVSKYTEEYKNGSSPYDSPYYYQVDNGMYVIKNKSTGKALKSINYTKVNLT